MSHTTRPQRPSFKKKRIAVTLALLCQATSACEDARADAQVSRAGPVCDQEPAPRWVLRDKDGNRVQALVEPRCYQYIDAPSAAECTPLAIASAKSHPCVRVIDHEGRYINLQYHLATGSIWECHGGSLADDPDYEIINLVSFRNDDCTGPPQMTPGKSQRTAFIRPEFTKARDIVFAEGTMWYVTGVGGCTFAESWYWSTPYEGAPMKCAGPHQPDFLCPIREVPAWVQDLLPNPPYTLAVEHE